MNFTSLIPYTESIPAPHEIFIVLEQFFFLIHIVIINSIVGLGIITLYKWKREASFFETNKPIVKKIPILFALGINMAIPALLFLQVVFGHLFYTSSILMGTFWILIIPFLIIAYYSSYFHYRKFQSSTLAKPALVLMILITLYIAFMLVNNLSMMEMPSKWTAYFSDRTGTILLWSVPSIYPRFLHFVVASLAVGGIAYGIYFSKKENSEEKVREGLKIFAYATMIQVVVGFWFLLSLPQEIMQKYMGKDIFATSVLVSGIVTALLAIFTSLRGRLKESIVLLALTLIFMAINRYNLRIFQLEGSFTPSQLNVTPQWDVFAVFVVILLIGTGTIIYMLRLSFSKK
ncbi:hypothetical protein TAGGR_2176 [Thermodesulfovibrio aggregans]|uniref:Uncharacterized protein n=1 Tax=Thermodesulfovibrio aggregans TaxID=86166 RepID=A0A0U9HQF0_9BACT|nr:hypothetical protein [Thermodesulfovibrio aggregans]GAQ95287.1 hypothetical protein TAGGR_2176 [Thermodesulfovibrio aggregans]